MTGREINLSMDGTKSAYVAFDELLEAVALASAGSAQITWIVDDQGKRVAAIVPAVHADFALAAKEVPDDPGGLMSPRPSSYYVATAGTVCTAHGFPLMPGTYQASERLLHADGGECGFWR